MNPITQIQHQFAHHLITHYAIDQELATKCNFILNVDPHKQEFGDLNANAAMVIGKKLGRNPREVAQELVDSFKHPLIEDVDIAGPGFINAWLTRAAVQQLAVELYEQKEAFFKLEKDTSKYHYSIEFISANPTGPLHLGHGRGGIIGDVLGNVLRFLGHQVTSEFYINDAGKQIERLGQSFKIRLEQIAGMEVSIPEDGYHGTYLVELAKECFAQFGSSALKKPDSFFADYAKEKLLEQQKKTLQEYGIIFDVWFSEKTLHESGAIDKALAQLQKDGFLYEHEGALWFASTRFGDDKDRVVRKSSGELTYVAAEIAYLRSKLDRGFNRLVMVLGHDHHSYVARMQAVLKAFGYEQSPLEVVLYQLVTMKMSGKLVQMSKRAGTMVTLDEVIHEVGTDVARFFYLNRKADAQLEFDLDLALKKTEENPVYYIQYAYVRTNSLRAKAQEEAHLKATDAVDSNILGRDEALLIKKMASLKEVLAVIAHNHQTHLLTYYIMELADIFHRYYAHHRIIDLNDVPTSKGRLLLVDLVNHCFATVLELLEITRPEKM
jgi:arginyl-tRNA synthetase